MKVAYRSSDTPWIAMGVLSLLSLFTVASGTAETPGTGELPPDLETASSVLLGKSGAMTYAEAIEIMERYAATDNIYALRMNASIWRTDLPYSQHRTSHVAAYLGARQLKVVSPTASIEGLLVDANEFNEIGDTFGDLDYSEHVDAMTDARSCEIVSQPVYGVTFGLDNKGVFVQGLPATNVVRYKEFAIRVDTEDAFHGMIPEPVASIERKIDAASWLFANNQLSHAQLEEKARQIWATLPQTAKVYVAKSDEDPYFKKHVDKAEVDFTKLLKQLARGNAVRARVILPDGSDRTVSWSLLLRDEKLPQPINYFDLVGYRYVNCVFGSIE